MTSTLEVDDSDVNEEEGGGVADSVVFSAGLGSDDVHSQGLGLFGSADVDAGVLKRLLDLHRVACPLQLVAEPVFDVVMSDGNLAMVAAAELVEHNITWEGGEHVDIRIAAGAANLACYRIVALESEAEEKGDDEAFVAHCVGRRDVGEP